MLTQKAFAPFAAIFVALGIGVVGSYGASIDQQRITQTQRRQVASAVGEYRAVIEGELNSSLFLANGLIAYVMTHSSLEREREEVIPLLKIMYEEGHHVRNIGLAPGNQLKYIYPVKGNEKALGLRYEELSDQWPVVERAIHEHRPILAGPVQLKQGGSGFIYRVPVFTGPQGNYWGMLSMVLDEKSLFEKIQIAPEANGLQLAIRGKDGAGSKGGTFLGNPSLFKEDAVTAPITTPGGSWEIAARPINGWGTDARILWIHVGSWGAGLLSGLFLFYLLRTIEKRLQAEKSLKLLVDTEPECVKVLACNGTLLQMNHAGLNMVEAESDEEVVGRNIIELVAPEYREAFVDLEQRVNNGESGALAFESIGLKGGRRWLESRATPLRDLEGHITGMLAVTRDITEQKQAEFSLQKITRNLKEAQRIAQLGSWELDLVNNHLTWSDEIYRIFEIDPEKFSASYEAFIAAIHPEDRDSVDRTYRESLSNRTPYEINHRLLMSDGNIKYVHEHCETEYAEDGTPLRSLGTVQDVTMRVLTEEAVKESEERFRTVADHTYDWEYWRGPSREFLYISPSCQRITGYTQAEFIANPELVRSIIHSDDRKLMDNHLTDYQDDTEHTLDFRIVRKDGEIRWIAHGCRPVYGHNGVFMGRRVSNRDITERKHIEESLHESEERFRLISASAKDAIIMVNALEEITYWNPAATAIFGYAEAEVMGKHLHHLLAPPDQQDVAHSRFAHFKISGEGPVIGKTFETHAIKKSGGVFPIELSISALRIKEQWHALGIVRDITERKAAEESIRQMAFYDILTGLPNRRLFEDRLHQLVTRGKREGLWLALLFIDLDNFKPINDTMGHEVGDWILQSASHRMQQCLRESDTAARIGGDEFVVLLPDAGNPNDVMGVAEKLRQTLRDPYVTPTGITLNISASIGGAMYPNHADNDRDLLRAADAAMYKAKQSGRNSVVLYTPLSTSETDVSMAERPSFVHLTWKNEYACGEPAIDSEHRDLVHLANNLLDMASKPDAKQEEVNAALEILQSHVLEHFAHEESILRSHQYGQLEAHVEKHRHLIKRIQDLREKSKVSEISFGELLNFLVSEVVADHLLHDDKAFFGIFAKKY